MDRLDDYISKDGINARVSLHSSGPQQPSDDEIDSRMSPEEYHNLAAQLHAARFEYHNRRTADNDVHGSYYYVVADRGDFDDSAWERGDAHHYNPNGVIDDWYGDHKNSREQTKSSVPWASVRGPSSTLQG